MNKTLWRSITCLGVAAGIILAAGPSQAQMYINKNSKTAKKYLACDNFGRVTKIISPEYKHLRRGCNKKLLSCDVGIAAVKGKPDPKYKAIWKDLHKITMRGKNREWMFGHWSRDMWPYGLVLWNPDEALKILTKKLNYKPKLFGFMANTKQPIFDALWYLADKNAADPMIKRMGNLLYTSMHTKDALMRFHTWGLSADQQKKVEAVCLKMFQGEGGKLAKGREKDIVVPCMRFLGLSASKNSDAIEFVENYLGENLKGDAARCLGGMGYKKAKSALKDVLAKQKTKKKIKKKKVTIWYPRKASVAAAVALLGMGDKDAGKAIKMWLKVDKKEKRLMDSSGFEMTVLELPWAGAKSKKKLVKMVKKAFKTVEKLSKKEDNLKNYANRAAIALVQAGDKSSMKYLLATLKGNKKDLRNEILIGLGGHTNYYGSFRTGTGGIGIGGKKGVGKKEVAALEKMILKRLKFWKSDRGAKQKAMRAILDMRARLKFAGK